MITIDPIRLNIEPGCRILDVGCGSGRHIADMCNLEGVTIMGSDLCFESLKSAVDRMTIHDRLSSQGSSKWGLSMVDIEHLPFDDNFFDLVICTEVLEHIRNDKKAIFELVRVLKPGSTLVISVPRYIPEKICWILSSAYVNAEEGHVRIYRKTDLMNLFELSGLAYDSHHYSHSLHTPFWLLKCLLEPTFASSPLIKLYHSFLVWDIMKGSNLFRLVDRILNPLFGKSIVMYAVKN